MHNRVRQHGLAGRQTFAEACNRSVVQQRWPHTVYTIDSLLCLGVALRVSVATSGETNFPTQHNGKLNMGWAR